MQDLERGRFTPYISPKTPAPTIQTYRNIEEKGKTAEYNNGASSVGQ